MLMKLANCFLLFILAIVLMYANVAKAQKMVEDGLVAYWPLDADTIDGKKVDDVIGDNDGVIVGGPSEVQGKVGEALTFNGLDSVDIEGTDSLNFNGKDEMSVMAWVNAGDDKDPVQGVVANPGGCCGTIIAQRDANGWALRYDGRNPGAEMEFIVCPGWQGDGGFGAPKFKKGEWHHLVGVVAQTNMYIYLDGEEVMKAAFAGPMNPVSSETEICHASDGGFVGIIDEVAIYDRALSEEEVKQNYQSKFGLAVGFNGKLAICWGKLKK